MNRSPSRLIAALVLSAATISMPAVAGLFSRTVTIRVQVVDADNRPVPYATVWMGRFDEDPSALAGFMLRTAARANPVFDFVVDVPHSVIVHSDDQGRLEFEDNGGELDESGVIRVEMVAIKRGYLPAFAGLDARRGSRPRATLKLQVDPAQAVDPRMELLDRAYATASNLVDGGAKESSKETIEILVRQLRGLATQFEREGHNERASAVYFNLAYLPSVDIIKDENGRVIASGYTNGYDDRNPRRVADRARAMKLSPNLLPMREDRVLDLLKTAHTPGSYADPVATRAAAREAEKLIEAFPRNVNPRVLHMLYMGYRKIEDNAASCRWLRAFYEYEPAYFDSRSSWAKFSAGRRFNRAGQKQEPVDCLLPSIVPER